MEDSGHKTPAMAERYKHLAPQFVADKVRQRATQKELPAILSSGDSDRKVQPV